MAQSISDELRGMARDLLYHINFGQPGVREINDGSIYDGLYVRAYIVEAMAVGARRDFIAVAMRIGAIQNWNDSKSPDRSFVARNKLPPWYGPDMPWAYKVDVDALHLWANGNLGEQVADVESSAIDPADAHEYAARCANAAYSAALRRISTGQSRPHDPTP